MNLEKEIFKKTTDEWYPNFPNDNSNKYSLTPIFDNGIGNIQQVKCK